MAAPDDRADALYRLPLDRFTAERNALSKELRAGGDRSAADEVKRLPKPTRAAWAANVAVRENPDAARALADSARLLQEAQKELLAGGDASALREAGDRARAAVDALVAAAPVSDDATVEKVRATLHAATVDPGVMAEVAAGRVLRERVASGFGGLAPATVPAGSRGGSRAAAAAARDEARRREKLRRAKEDEAAAEQEVAAAQRALDQVESTVAERRAQVRDAQARLKDARRRRERAEG